MKAVFLAARSAALLANLAVLVIALLWLATYGSLAAWLVQVGVLALVVVNSRLLWPWPLRAEQVQGSAMLGRSLSWLALIGGLVLGIAANSGPLKDWRAVFVALAVSGAFNLLALSRSLGGPGQVSIEQ